MTADFTGVHFKPSLEPVKIVPLGPTATNMLFPKVSELRGTLTPEFLTVHVFASTDVYINPFPNVTA